MRTALRAFIQRNEVEKETEKKNKKNHKRKSNKPEQFFQFHLPSGANITAKLLSDDEEKKARQIWLL